MDHYNSKTACLLGKLNRSQHYAVTISSTCTLFAESEEFVLAVPECRRHETVHKDQYERYGWFGFMARYLWWSLRYSYQDNPLEKEARGEIAL
jgi:hypothetical protein